MANRRRRGEVDQVESFEISGKISKLTLYAARSSACQTKETFIFSIYEAWQVPERFISIPGIQELEEFYFL